MECDGKVKQTEAERRWPCWGNMSKHWWMNLLCFFPFRPNNKPLRDCLDEKNLLLSIWCFSFLTFFTPISRKEVWATRSFDIVLWLVPESGFIYTFRLITWLFCSLDYSSAVYPNSSGRRVSGASDRYTTLLKDMSQLSVCAVILHRVFYSRDAGWAALTRLLHRPPGV